MTNERINNDDRILAIEEIEAAQLTSLDLIAELDNDPSAMCMSAQIAGAPCAVEVIYYPDSQRAGIAAGSDAEWTDAASAEDGLLRWLDGEMIN